MRNKFLPISTDDLRERGWEELDVILITGDAYVDHPSYGAAIIGRVLEDAGFKAGIIAQPDWRHSDDFLKLGRPRLFFGITAGNLDSILSNYTANKSIRKKDDYSPGGNIGLRPNRAAIVYANKVKELFPDTPIVLGGIEASLRRLAHYDYWSDSVRRSILIDSKADLLVYGMGEKQAVETAIRLSDGRKIKDLDNIRGTVAVRNNISGLTDYVIIPSFEEVASDKDKFIEAFKIIYLENDPFKGKTVIQKYGDRFIIQYPPVLPLTTKELDRVYSLNFARDWHPIYDKAKGVPGFETVRNSIISHRGCCGECSFCSLGFHQGRIIQSRSPESILREIKLLADSKDFKGTITDIGGPTANLYGAKCKSWEANGACKYKKCLTPTKCKNLQLGYREALKLLRDALKIPKVKHVFIGSGVRYDLLVDRYSDEYLKELCKHHISGRLKVAPEHTVDYILELMNKPAFKTYEAFCKKFRDINKALNKKQYLVNYFITSHPGSDLETALKMALYLAERRLRPEQIQDFIPLPMTVSGCMYWANKHPFTGEKLYVAKDVKEKRMERALIQYSQPKNRRLVSEALRSLNKLNLEKVLLKA